MPHLRAADVTFLQLRNTVFCVSCELISYNNSSKCLACSSTALLSLPHLLGGSLGHQDHARLIGDEVIDSVVEKILVQNDKNDVVREVPTAAPAFASEAKRFRAQLKFLILQFRIGPEFCDVGRAQRKADPLDRKSLSAFKRIVRAVEGMTV